MSILTSIDFPILCVGVGVDVAHVEQFKTGVIHGYEGVEPHKFNDMYKQLAYATGGLVGTRLKEVYP